MISIRWHHLFTFYWLTCKISNLKNICNGTRKRTRAQALVHDPWKLFVIRLCFSRVIKFMLINWTCFRISKWVGILPRVGVLSFLGFGQVFFMWHFVLQTLPTLTLEFLIFKNFGHSILGSQFCCLDLIF